MKSKRIAPVYYRGLDISLYLKQRLGACDSANRFKGHGVKRAASLIASARHGRVWYSWLIRRAWGLGILPESFVPHDMFGIRLFRDVPLKKAQDFFVADFKKWRKEQAKRQEKNAKRRGR